MTLVSMAQLGLPSTVSSDLSPDQARRLAVSLGTTDELRRGDSLPLLWHWAFFSHAAPADRLGTDGHPRLPANGPTEGLPRRMWAGGQVEVEGPLVVGVDAVRTSHVLSAERKSGRSGTFLLVSLRHEVVQAGRRVLAEVQDLVYREPASSLVDQPRGGEAVEAPAGGWVDSFTPDASMLFQFSAVTFNSHRIHYDASYAADEGYPGLVVHGPLTALRLAESARARGIAGRRFQFRASAPLFAGESIALVGMAEEDGVALRALRIDGAEAMTARLAG